MPAEGQKIRNVSMLHVPHLNILAHLGQYGLRSPSTKEFHGIVHGAL